MFFKKDKEENLKIDEAEKCLVKIFEERTSGIEGLGKRCAEKILEARNSFMLHCSSFEELEAEPYMEDLYMSNPNSIKSQKVLYARSVRHTAEKMSLDESHEKTAYERSVSLLGRADSAINEILKTNAAFRTVLYSYSNKMGEMKKDFTTMERSAGELRKALDRKDVEFSHFKSINNGIAKLRDAELERKALEEEMKYAGEGSSERKDTETELRKELLGSLDVKNAEIVEIDTRISALSERISLLCVPLEKLARKHDHLSMDKLKLSDFLSDPKSTIRSRADHAAFLELLVKMRENIEKDIISAKNKKSVLDAISELYKSDIFSMVESEKNLMAERIGLETDARVIKESIGKADKRIGGIENADAERNAAEARIRELGKISETAKQSIEMMFFEYYRKKIRIVTI